MRHQWVFSLVTRLHQVSYHTFYQWVTYDWWEPRLLFSFICDLSEWTTGISRLLNSLNAWRQGLTVLIKAGSKWYYSPAMTGEGQERKGEGEGGEGRGNSFCEQCNSGSACSLSAAVCGERCISGTWESGYRVVRTLLWAAWSNSKAWAAEALGSL